MRRKTGSIRKKSSRRVNRKLSKGSRNGVVAPAASRYLSQYNEYLRVILDHVEDLIAVIDLKGKRLYNSPSYQAVLGDSHHLVGTDSFSEIHPDDRVRIKRIFEKTIRSGVGQRSEYRFVRADGAIRYIDSLGSVVRDAKGTPIMLVIVSRDVTERREAEDRLKSAYRSLKTAQVKLFQSEKLASIGQLAAGVAHELKNPLGILLQGANYLEHQVKMEQSSADVFKMMKDAVERSDRIIRGLLNYAQPIPLSLQPGNLRKIVDDALQAVKNQFPDNKVCVKNKMLRNLPLVLLDQHYMKQAFINIITNAFQAMSENGALTITCDVKKLTKPGLGVGDRVTDYFRVGDRVIRCHIKDTGGGIPKEQIDKVFHPFYTTKSHEGGSGLGLAMVKAIVEGHLGLIHIESVQAKGTSITVTLPVAKGGTHE